MNQKRQRGFTLVEILVVIVILSLLATVVGTDVFKSLFQSEEDIARLNVSEIDKAMEIFYLEQRRVPESLEDLITPDEKGRVYLKGFTEAPKDPWGNPYEVRPGETPGSWEILCWGPDKQPDTDDDISSKSIKDQKKS